jgi:hypothetical protein
VISEDAIEQKPAMKKRIFVASLLAMAAVGTHWLPGRTIVPMESQPAQQVGVASADKLMAGPNSLLGDAVADPVAKAVASADLGQYHLDMDNVVDQAGLSQVLNGMNPISSELAVPSGAVNSGQTSAVPEPTTAGLLLLAATPVLARRKGRGAARA